MSNIIYTFIPVKQRIVPENAKAAKMNIYTYVHCCKILNFIELKTIYNVPVVIDLSFEDGRIEFE